MKKALFICLAFAAFGMVSMTTENGSNALIDVNSSAKEYVYIYLQNECDHSVKYEYKYPGHGSSGSVSANYKQRVTLQTGAKLYIDGSFLTEITSSDDKKIFVICE
ncbi:MAG: hypothetical protein ACI837_001080 [Crocinitomicaceae bacterium]|jgi:hypothetical protein